MTAFVWVRYRRALFAIICLLACIRPHAVIAQDMLPPIKVEFEALQPRPDALKLVGYLRRPERSGPSPAVVLLHGCDGSWLGIDRRWGARLQSWGYATLAVDSYGPRGIANTCSAPISDDAFDGYAGLDFLAHQPDIDGSNVALLGTSRGGGLTLTSVEQGAIERLSKRKFKAAVALYPPCVGDAGLVTIPALVLIGASDDWTPADDCRDMAAGHSSIGVSRVPGDRSNLHLVVYPGAYHSFDNDRLQPGKRYFGHWVEYNEAATQASVDQVRTFLRNELGGQ